MMAAANKSHCEVQLDMEDLENYEEDVVQNVATSKENLCYPIGQESPASFMSAIQELGHRILSTSE